MGSTKRDIPLQGAEASSSNGNFSSSLVRPVHRQDNGASATTDTGRDGSASSPDAVDRVGRRISQAYATMGLTERQMLALAKQKSLTDSNKTNHKFQAKRSRSPPGSEPSEQNKVPRRPQPKSPRSPTSPNGRSRRDEEVSRPKKAKSLKDESTRQSREEQGPIIPKDFDSWPESQKASWKGLPDNPDHYYYYYHDPDVVEKSNGWRGVDKGQFFQALREHPPRSPSTGGPNWGVFAMKVRSKTGLQCEQYFEELKRKGKVTDDDLDGLKTDILTNSDEEDHSEENGNLSADDHHGGNHSSIFTKPKTHAVDNSERVNGVSAKSGLSSTVDKIPPVAKEKSCEIEQKPVKVVEIQASGSRRKHKNTWIRNSPKPPKTTNHEKQNGVPRDTSLISASSVPKEDTSTNAKHAEVSEGNKDFILLPSMKERNNMEDQNKNESSGILPVKSDPNAFEKGEKVRESSEMDHRKKFDGCSWPKSTLEPVSESAPRHSASTDGITEPKEDKVQLGPARSTTVESPDTDRSKEQAGPSVAVASLRADNSSVLSEDPIAGPKSPEIESDLATKKKALLRDVAGEAQSGVESSDMNGLKLPDVKLADEETDVQMTEGENGQDAQPVPMMPILQNSGRQDSGAKESSTTFENEIKHINEKKDAISAGNGLSASESLSQVVRVAESVPQAADLKSQAVEAADESTERSNSSSGLSCEALDNSVKVKTKAECQENTSDESPAEEIEATMNDVVLTSSDDKTSERPDKTEAVVNEKTPKTNESEPFGISSMSEGALRESSSNKDEVPEKDPNEYVHYVKKICNGRKWTTLNVEGACKVLLSEFHIAQPDGVYRE